jgi:hypothetical protein
MKKTHYEQTKCNSKRKRKEREKRKEKDAGEEYQNFSLFVSFGNKRIIGFFEGIHC